MKECIINNIDIESTFPVINKGVTAHIWPDRICTFTTDTNIERKKILENSKIITMNKYGLAILKSCNGKNSIKDIIVKMKNEFQLDNSDNTIADKVIDFLEKSRINFKHINYLNTPLNEEKQLTLTGSEEYYTPVHASLEITTKCNLRCKHCYRLNNNVEDKELSFEQVTKIIDQLSQIGVRIIELTGGEVTTHPRVIEIIEYAARKMNLVGVLTNGVKFDDYRIEELKPYKDKIIWSISLDSLDEEYHDQFRGKIGAYRNTVRTIRNLRNNDFFVKVAMSVTVDNINQIIPSIDFAHEELNANVFGFSTILPFGRGDELNNIDLDDSMIMQLIEAQKYSKRYPNFVREITPNDITNMINKTKNCGMGWKSVTIDPSGNIRPCVMVEENSLIIGNILGEDITEIFKKPIVHKLRNIVVPNPAICGECEQLKFCHGCVYRGLLKNQERIKHSIDVCNWAKEFGLVDIENIILSSCGSCSF
jgi:radical SAM protein with 4Fe4S-binding SPASM domain